MADNSAESSSSSSLPTSDFHFHPTDEEIIINYLKPKNYGKLFSIDRIPVIYNYKFEPGDLPGQSSSIKNRNSEWYFFSPLDKKSGSGARTNRTTKQGYWKVTGKDRSVWQGKDKMVGMKKTLVFYAGLAPHGERTNWIMHEYSLVDDNVESKLNQIQDAFVLCKVFCRKQEYVQQKIPVDDDCGEESVSSQLGTNGIILIIISFLILCSDMPTFLTLLVVWLADPPFMVITLILIIAATNILWKFESLESIISKVGDFIVDYNHQAIQNNIGCNISIKRTFLLNIMVILITVLFVIGIALKLWIMDLPTSFMYLNITISLIIVLMIVYLWFRPKTKNGNPQLVLVWTIVLLICNREPNVEECPAILMHCHHIANLIVFTMAAYLAIRKSLGPDQLPAQYDSMEASLANDGGFDDHVFELDNKLSDMEKIYSDENFRRCFGLLVYLFPIDYEFEKKDVIQLWMAEGFIHPSVQTNELLEDAASAYFDVFTATSIFQSSCSGGNIRPRYKLNHSILDDLHKPPSHEYCRIESGKPVNLSGNTLHTSFICDSSTDPVAFEALYQSNRLSTLMLLHEQRYSSINRVPYDLFLKLPLLRALDLSGTNITELPSSVRNLKHLRLLNLSKTLVKRLPESLCSLYLMQTLILRDCSKLVGLPKEMRKLVNLRHLDLDIGSLLISMPPGIGDMTELQTLPAFIVGKDGGSRITELKHMPNLRGSLAIMMLENISDTEEAKEAALYKKKYLERLELQWTELQDGVDEVLQHLQPRENIKELQIVSYGGTKFPGWIGNPVFSKLATITLHNCSKCEVLPSLGKLPLLKRLQISEMHAVKTIDTRFCGREMVTPLLDLVLKAVGRQTNLCKGFPSLNNLKISGMPTLEKWRGMEEGDFCLLHKLSLSRFAKLTALPELSVLKALQELEISLCPVLQFIPKKSLPTSLQSLLIISCPLLKEQCQKEGENWGEIVHIPSIWIDNQQIL